jgi:hypothetical protein
VWGDDQLKSCGLPGGFCPYLICDREQCWRLQELHSCDGKRQAIEPYRWIRAMRGPSRAELIQASDGERYVVKRQGLQSNRVLVNELICALLLRDLGIATANPALIRSTRKSGEDGIKNEADLAVPSATADSHWNFGSRVPADPDKVALWDFLPDALLDQVVNLCDFVGAFVFDQWVAKIDRRQAVFIRSSAWPPGHSPFLNPSASGWLALLIGNTGAFGGIRWNLQSDAAQTRYDRLKVYQTVQSADSFAPWIERIQALASERIWQLQKHIPPEWIQGEEEALERLLGELIARRRQLPELMDASLGALTPASALKATV